MNTFDEKLQDILNSAWHEGFAFHEEELPNLLKELKALFEAEMLDIIEEDEQTDFSLSENQLSPYLRAEELSRNHLKEKQRAALKEKLGREDKQPIWDALNNSDA